MSSDDFGSRFRGLTIDELQRMGRIPRFRLPSPLLMDFESYSRAPLAHAFGDSLMYSAAAWPSPSRAIPPMLKAATVTPVEPESSSVQMLRALLADRREVKRNAESSHRSRIKQAEDAERRAADLRKRAEDDTATVAQADTEIAAVLADIEKLGGRPETEKDA